MYEISSQCVLTLQTAYYYFCERRECLIDAAIGSTNGTSTQDDGILFYYMYSYINTLALNRY